MTLRHRAALLCTVLALSALVACSDDGGGGGSASGSATKLIIGTDAEPTTLDPQLLDDGGKDLATWRIYEGLVDFDKSGEVVPELAAELPTQVDPTTWRVKLLPDLEFTNGEPLNADTVVFNVERILDPDYNSTFAAELATIDHAEKVDDLTVDIVTKAPDPILLYRLRTMRIVPQEYSQDPDFAESPIGTGPYEFVAWDRGSSLTIKASPDWRGDQPSVKEVEIRFIPDPTTRLQALQSGEIDIAGALGPEQMDTLPQTLVSDAPVDVSWIRINTGKPPYDDIRVRQALNYAIDKETLSEQLFGGIAEPAACQLTPPQAGGTNADLEPFPYDPDKAKELLKEAGADGMKITVEWATGVYPKDKEFGEAVKGMLSDVGLDVTVNYLAVDPFINGFYQAGPDAPPLFYGQTDNALNHAARQLSTFYSSQPYVGSALGPEDQKTADEMVNAALGANSVEEAQTAYEAFQKWQCDQSLFVYLLDHKEIWGATDAVQYQPGARGLFVKMYFDEITLSS
jgi:peptide/nickel transport system substrate-binding protein